MREFLANRDLSGRAALGLLGVLAAAGGSSCAGPSEWSAPVPEQATGAPIAVEREAIVTPVQATYIVAAEGNDGYCDDVLFTNNHGGAIQACIDHANADGGGVVFVRAGWYTTGTWALNLKRNVTLRGAGLGGGSDSGTNLGPSSGTQIISTAGDTTVVEGLKFYPQAGGIAIRLAPDLTSRYGVRIERNYFQGTFSSATAVYANAGNAKSLGNIYIRGNEFSGPNTGIPFPAVDLNGSMFNVHVENNLVEGVGPTMLRLVAPGAGRGIIVSGNTLKANGAALPTGIIVDGMTDSQIRDNSLTNFTTPITVSGSVGCGAMVSGNLMNGRPSVSANCAERTTLVANSDNRSSSGGALVGRAGVLVRARRSGNQTFQPAAGAVVQYTTEDVDNGNNLDSTGTFTAPQTGIYHAHACTRVNITNFGANDAMNISFVILPVAGSAYTFSLNRMSPAGSPDSFTNCVDDMVPLARGERLQVAVDGSGSGTRTIVGIGFYSTFLHIQQVSD